MASAEKRQAAIRQAVRLVHSGCPWLRRAGSARLATCQVGLDALSYQVRSTQPKDEMDLNEMVPFEHRGVTYYANEEEQIYDASGRALGYISSRGGQYAWVATFTIADNELEFARGSGVWIGNEVIEPAVEAILNAHAHRCGVCRGFGRVKADITDRLVECSYCEGKGLTS